MYLNMFLVDYEINIKIIGTGLQIMEEMKLLIYKIGYIEFHDLQISLLARSVGDTPLCYLSTTSNETTDPNNYPVKEFHCF